MTLKTNHKALLAELLPIVAGFVALSFVPLVFWSQRRNASTIASGEPLSLSELALWWPICLPQVVALFVFAACGVGWLIRGRIVFGVGLLLGRGFVALGFILWAMGGGEGDSWYDPISQQRALTQFALCMAITAVSVVALTYWTGRHPESAAA